MSSPRIILIISSVIILSLIINENFNNAIPESMQGALESKDQEMHTVSPRVSQKNDAVSALRKEVQQIKAEMNRLKLQITYSRKDLTMLIENQQTGEYPIPESSVNQELIPDIVGQGVVQVEQQLASMEASMAEESVDSEWSSVTTDQIQAAFDSAELNGAEVVDLECRKTLCRIDMNIDNPLLAAEYQLWLSAKIGNILPQASMTISQDEEGYPSAILFLAREGYNLPVAEE